MDLDEGGRWREVNYEHYKVCKYSAHDRILNIDHISANTTDPDPAAFISHAKLLLSLPGGYPCVSYRPDRFEDKSVAVEFAKLMHAWKEEQKNL